MFTNIRCAVHSAVSGTKNLDELCKRIVRTCADEFSAEVCSIWKIYEDKQGKPHLNLLAAYAKSPRTIAQEITYAIYPEESSGKKSDGVTGFVAQTKKEVIISSFEELQEKYQFCWKGRMDQTQWFGRPEFYFKSMVALPLLLGKQCVGVVKLENKINSTTGFSKSDIDSLKGLVPDIALAVHILNLHERHEERLIKVPTKVVDELLSPFEPKPLVSEIIKTVADNLHAEICSLWLIDISNKELLLAEGYGFPMSDLKEQTYLLCDSHESDEEIEGITAWVAIRNKAYWASSAEELRKHPSWRGKWDEKMWTYSNFRGLYATPLRRKSEVIGVLKVENPKEAAIFTKSDQALCDLFASLIVLVLDLEQLLRTSLISDLAHLIRSPIGQVSMNLSGLERELERLNDENAVYRQKNIEQYILFIKKALLAINVASKTLVTFAHRSNSPTSEVKLERCLIVDLLQNRISEIEPLLYDDITIKTEFYNSSKELTTILDITDKIRLQIAIDNIIHNAIKYSKRDGEVIIRLFKETNLGVLEVLDFGHGISEELLPRIFEAGFSTRAKGHLQGTGMGLTTVKQILDRLGWKFKISSVKDFGTKFILYIPIVTDVSEIDLNLLND